MATFDLLADLPLTVDDCDLEALERDVSSDFTRQSTVIRLRGGGYEGVGEDVTYDGEDHGVLQEAGPPEGLAGEGTLADFCDRLEALELWPRPPVREPSRLYRIWAFESAALDLALRQAGRALHEVLDRPLRPVTFVVSLRLPDPPSIDPIRRRLERYPSLRFKLDPTSDWDAALVERLVATGAVDSVDLKGQYEGTVVDQGADAELYRLVAESFPDAWIEDPRLTDETDEVLRPHRDRITWDAIIHSVGDIEALPFPPRMVNVKPSRLGPLRGLLAAYDFCAERAIGMYGGGQFELGPGRGQIQLLASIFHPDTPNDVAPGGFNDADPPPGLPTSPLEPRASATGFRWGEWSER
jgi:hypothetical protein